MNDNTYETCASKKERKYIGFRGEWYDVTDFVNRHPGGNVIEKFVGRDATHVIETAHRKDVLKFRKPVQYDPKNDDTPRPYRYEPSPFAMQMLALHHKFQKEGYYNGSLLWSVMKFSIASSLHLTILALVFHFGDLFPVQCLCSFLLAAFWQQCGLLMHDLMHSQAFQNYKIDERVGVFFGTFGFGMSARFWKDEHVLHHALTNTVDYHSGFVDPQACEEVWAQNEKLFPFMRSKIQHALIKVQYWTFIPLCVIFGRFGILYKSYRHEHRKDVWVAFALHVVWMTWLLSLLPSWKVRLFFYCGASFGEGILHIQLLMNHYSKPFYEKETMHQTEFFRAMVELNINLVSPWWMDWFHGGLNFHIEHHCFPRLPRNRFREVSAMIKKICTEHDIFYDECSFTCALRRTLARLESASKVFEAMTNFDHGTEDGIADM